MLSAILNNAGMNITGISVSIVGGGSISVSPGSSISAGQATSIGTYASGGNRSIVTVNYTVNGAVYTKVLNKGLPLPNDQCGILIVTADGHLVEIEVIF